MKIALYIGNHKKDSFMVRLGWWITRVVQKGPYGNVTHCEAIHEEYGNGYVKIASASVRDEGVRSTLAKLNPENWAIVDVPMWDVQKSKDLLVQTKGRKYDWRGAVATVFLGTHSGDKWFCNEWVAFPFLLAASNFGPNHFAAICYSLGKDVTEEFFKPQV